MNNISFVFPSSYPPKEEFCDAANLPEHCSNRQICPCTHRLKIEKGAVVELIIVDESRSKSVPEMQKKKTFKMTSFL
jgi:hypothetical protein